MSRNPSSTQRRIIDAAFDLFTSQGFDATTTREIADRAGVNEVTLFRNFGSKHDLLLAVVEDSGVLARLPESFRESVAQTRSLSEAVGHYASDRLRTLEQQSELLRAFVGEAGQYSLENRRAFGQELMRATRDVARYLATAMKREGVEPQVSPEKLAGLLDSLLLGYLITELTSEFRGLWEDREDFLDSLVEVCLHGAVSSPFTGKSDRVQERSLAEEVPPLLSAEARVTDLPADLVHSILRQAKKQGTQDYAIVYLLFAAGLLPEEVVGLKRSHHICNSRQHLVQVERGAVRQVTVNQWIMGKRYGSYNNNPLSRWLKSRNDEKSALFLSELGQPLSEPELLSVWERATAGLLTPENTPPRIEQARQTWCVEMLLKGMSPEDLSILSGSTTEQLQPYLRRAREKVALERAIQLDRQSS